jgi:hypothetical protein
MCGVYNRSLAADNAVVKKAALSAVFLCPFSEISYYLSNITNSITTEIKKNGGTRK